MAEVEWYRLVDDTEECRYIGTCKDEESQDGVKLRIADAFARFGVDTETAERWYGSGEIGRIVLPHLGEKTRQPLTAPTLGIVTLQVGRHLVLKTLISMR